MFYWIKLHHYEHGWREIYYYATDEVRCAMMGEELREHMRNGWMIVCGRMLNGGEYEA